MERLNGDILYRYFFVDQYHSQTIGWEIVARPSDNVRRIDLGLRFAMGINAGHGCLGPLRARRISNELYLRLFDRHRRNKIFRIDVIYFLLLHTDVTYHILLQSNC